MLTVPGAVDSKMNKNPRKIPTLKMKGLQWTKIPYIKIKGTIWEKFPEGKF